MFHKSSYQSLPLQTTKLLKQQGDGGVKKSYLYRSSWFFTLIRRLKYLLFVMVMLVWVIGFITVGVLLLKIHTIISRRTAITFILVGLFPILLLFLYVLVRRWRHGTFDWGIFKCN
jgi:hypothetical protein